MPHKQHSKKKMYHTVPYRDNRKTAYGLTIGNIVSSNFWYNEPLTWEVIGFDDELVKLSCFEFDIPIQTSHYSTLIRI